MNLASDPPLAETTPQHGTARVQNKRILVSNRDGLGLSASAWVPVQPGLPVWMNGCRATGHVVLTGATAADEVTAWLIQFDP
ncbi:MAG: hypothetical protein IRZ33_01580 [Alicyclobacillaceae bacterium]|nr:hypothetical protein [Alicyclobacillaceae bacterium]